MTEPTSTGPTDGREEAGTEVEATLAVVSETPAAVAERIAGLDGLGSYRLEWGGADELRDVYLDTPDRELRERGLALRLRRGENGWHITLKGPSRPAAGGGVERSELELRWSTEAFERILRSLRGRGVELEDGPCDFSGAESVDPVEAAEYSGFGVIQDRRTRRRKAQVLPPADGGDEPLAWLALDTVFFRTGNGQSVRHREVEIEATPAAPEGLPGDLAVRLRRRFGDALRPWEHSKLATGAAVEALDPPAGPEGSLGPAAYEVLQRQLAGEGGEGG